MNAAFRIAALSAGLAMAAAALASASEGRAEVTATLANGDRLTGELVRFTRDAVVLKTAYLGEVVLSREAIASLSGGEPSGEEGSSEDAGAGAQGEQVAEAEGGAQEAAPEGLPAASDGDADLPPPQAWERQTWMTRLGLDEWEKRVDLGLTSQMGRTDKTDFSFRYNMERQGERDQLRFAASYLYGETEDITSTDKLDSSFRWRRNLGRGGFYQANTAYGFDNIKDIDADIRQNLGLGYRLIDAQALSLSTGAGASGRYRARTGVENDLEYLVDLFEDLRYQINERMSLNQEASFATPLGEVNDFIFNFKAALVSNLSHALDLSVRYEVEFDNSLEDESREDQRVISSLGYKF